MAEKKIPPTERIAASFKELALVSPEVESAAADLASSISNLECHLRRIDTQVSAWHEIAGSDDGSGPYWSRDIGWSNINNTWSIAIRKTDGHHAGQHEEEIWTFKKAPRWMAIEAAGKLPDLFETLIKRSRETITKLQARKKEADALSEAIEAVLPEATEQVNALKKGNEVNNERTTSKANCTRSNRDTRARQEEDTCGQLKCLLFQKSNISSS